MPILSLLFILSNTLRSGEAWPAEPRPKVALARRGGGKAALALAATSPHRMRRGASHPIFPLSPSFSHSSHALQ
jgi:hypothetical protein